MINDLLLKRNELDQKGRQLSAHYTTVNNYLKEYYGKPRKIRRTFFLSKDQMDQRKKFCRMILDKHIKAEQFFLAINQK